MQGKRNLSRDFGKRAGRESNWEANKKPRTHWEGAPPENAAFEEYYRTQGICPAEEWDAFLACLRLQLPLTFRINGSGRFADTLRAKLETDFFSDFTSGPIIIDGEVINPPAVLPWYPNKLGWQLEFSRTQLRKIPKLEALHEFMKRETEIGAITRQEAVSMVPPLFMDVQSHHRVLDVCAAPGSKTAQLLEALHAAPGEPTGVVIANDADSQRCNMLTHQTQRIRSPAFLITNHEAQLFPMIYDLDPDSPDERIMYDRILCDVPCSGDGTLRKQPDIWRRWTATNGNGLHMLQLRITLRACELLRVGGRMVYSTCTFNPIEDEAVVREVLRRTNGAMRLIDVSAELPELRRNPGLRTWKVRDRDTWYDSWEQGQNGYKLDPSMFPGPTDEDLGLERCMRFLPHHQNTGGFFVCVLEKVAALEGLRYPTMEHRSTNQKNNKNNNNKGEEKKVADGVEEEKAEEAVAVVKEVEMGVEAEDAAAVVVGEEKEVEQVVEEGPAAAAVVTEPATTTTTVVAAPEAEAVEEKKFDKPKGGKKPEKVLPDWGLRGGGCRNTTTTTATDAKPAAAEGEQGGAGPSTEAAAPPPPAVAAARKDGQRGRWRGVDPIVPFVDAEELAGIRATYGLSEDCPITTSLIARSTDHRPKKLTYINHGCKMVLLMDEREQLKVTAGGVKLFERQDNKDNLLACCYRISQEGLPLLLPYMTKQKFEPTVEEFIKVLTERAVGLPAESKVHITTTTTTTTNIAPVEETAEGVDVMEEVKEEVDAAAVAIDTDVVDATTTAPTDADVAAPSTAAAVVEEATTAAATVNKTRFLFSDPSSLEQLSKVDYGCCVLTLRAADVAALGLTAEGALSANAPIAVVCWRGRGTLNVLVSKQECSQMSERLEAAIAASKQTTQ